MLTESATEWRRDVPSSLPGAEQPVTTGAEIAARALELAVAGSDPTIAVAELLTLAASPRSALEEAHLVLVQRLHRRSDDFAATAALFLVSAALWDAGWQPNAVPTPQLKRRRRGRRFTKQIASIF